MKYRGISAHVEYANQTLDWFSTDNEKTFQWHLRKDFGRVEDAGWLDRNVKYSFNSLGFRSEEFEDGKKAVVFLGGSEVIGTGVPIKDAFPELVADKLKLKCYNLSQSGAANDTIYRMASYWLPKLKPKLVVMLSPPPFRIEVIDTFQDQPITFYVPQFYAKDPFFKTWLSCDDNSLLNEEKNKLAVQHICKVNKIKLVSFEDTEFEQLDHARDFIHKGIQSHAVFAQQILAKI